MKTNITWPSKTAFVICAYFVVFMSIAAVSANGASVIKISAGGDHSMFITNDNACWAMGANNSGQLGDGTITRRLLPMQIATNVIAVSAGSHGSLSHSLYVTGDGKLWAMGSNGSGQLGDGTTTERH
jgi:alpha-tubulin suppressor-like RCC1 family protein